MRSLLSLSVLSVLLLGGAAPAAERVALVIGNDAYPGRAKLDNCVKDATDVKALLRDRLGFGAEHIVFVADADETGMLAGLERFKAKAAEAEIALVYYAGHGMESRDGRETFLLPVDADLAGASESETILKRDGLRLSDVLEELGDTTSGAKVVLLDCCRDRPKARTAKGEAVEGGGLAAVPDEKIPADTFILLAAAPNRQASDGVDNGPFTKALLEVLPEAGQSMFDAFFAVSDRVQAATQKEQVPWLKFDGSGAVFRRNALVGEPVKMAEVKDDSAAEIAALKKRLAEMARAKEAETPQSVPSAVMTPPALPATPALARPIAESVPLGGSSLARGAVGDSRSFEIGGGQKVVLKYVPGGEFLMGSPKGEKERIADEEQVRVTLSSHYWMGETEVTQGQWGAVMGSAPSRFKGATLPVETVSWEDAQEFVKKLNAKGAPAPGWKWALPTEAQWERACRGGTEASFSVGNSLASTQANFDGNYPYGDGKKGPNLKKTASVKSYAANEYGLYEMHGNVHEWCLDSVEGGTKLPGGVDPLGSTGSGRVLRGGAWCDSGMFCRSAYRRGFTPDERQGYLGFRLVAVLAGP